MDVFRHQRSIDFPIGVPFSLISLHDDGGEREGDGQQGNADREQIRVLGKPRHPERLWLLP